MQQVFKHGQTEHALSLSRAAQGYRLHLGGQSLLVAIEEHAGGRARLDVDGRSYEIFAVEHGDDVFVQLDGAAYALRYLDPLAMLADQAGGGEDAVRAPMPGTVVSVAVKAGDAVTRGQPLMVIESMKMETTLTAHRDGRIAKMACAQGQGFERDAVLLSLEPAGDAA